MDVRVGLQRKLSAEELGFFNLCCWRRLLRDHWTARRSNQSILKEVILEYSLEGLMLKLQSFGHLMWRVNSLEKILTVGTTEGKRRRKTEEEMVGWYHWLNGHELEHTPGEREPGMLSPWGHKETWLSDSATSTISSLGDMSVLWLPGCCGLP